MGLRHLKGGKFLKLRFDKDDDLVIEDIPDDLMVTVRGLAVRRSVSEEDMWRELITQLLAPRPTDCTA